MKKSSKRLALTTQTIRALQTDDLARVQGGSIMASGTSVVYNPSGGVTSLHGMPVGTSVIRH